MQQHSVQPGCKEVLAGFALRRAPALTTRAALHCRGRSRSGPAGPRPCVRRAGSAARPARGALAWPLERGGPAPAGPSSFSSSSGKARRRKRRREGSAPPVCRKPRLCPAPAVPGPAGTAPGPAQAPRPAAMAARPALTHDLHPANGAGVALHVPAPHGHRVPLLQREHLVGGARLGARGARQRVGGARLVPVLHIGHGGGAGTRRPRGRQRHPPAAAAAAQPRPRRGQRDRPGGGAGRARGARSPCRETERLHRAFKHFVCSSRTPRRC